MKKLCLIFALLAAPAFAERIQKGVEVCLVAHVEAVDGKWIPQRGVRIYRLPDGGFYGAVIKNGFEQFEFGGSSEFDDTIRRALDGIPSGIADWNSEFDATQERAHKSLQVPFVLDGWKTQIRVTTEKTKAELLRDNAGTYVIYLAEHSGPLAKLKRLLDAIALALGREQMAI